MRPSTALLVAVAFAGHLSSAWAQIDAPRPVQEMEASPPPPAPKPSEEEAPLQIEEAPAPASESGSVRLPPKAEKEEKGSSAKETKETKETKDAKAAKDVKKPQPEAAPTAPAPPAHLLVTSATDADLEAALARYRKAAAASNLSQAEAAQKELVALKAELGAMDLEPFALALMRTSQEREEAGDSSGAVGAAKAAVEVAPDFPFAHLRLAGAYFTADMTELGRVFQALGVAARTFAADPRYLRPALMDLATSLLFALLATSVTVVGVFFIRRVRYFLHDFHHVFPNGAAHWQTSAIAVLLLCLPLVFRLGVVPQLFALLFAVTLHLTRAERLVASMLLMTLGLTPLLAGELIPHTDFAGTPAEDVYLTERGGELASSASAKILRRVQTGSATYGELYALGRYELRRGKIEDAIKHLKAAGTQRNNQAPLLTNLGNALLVKGDFDGAAEMYRGAVAADPNFAPAPFNLSRLHTRRALTLSTDGAAKEKILADDAFRSATAIKPSLASLAEPPPDKAYANLYLLSPPLATSEISELAAVGSHGDKIQAQLSTFLLGELEPPLSFAFPVVLGLTAILFGISGARLSIGRECSKCGRPVCRRCDPDLPAKGELCNQCVHVFARRGAVAATARVRKQIEINRFHDRSDKISYGLGLICSGAGHLFSGSPVRGALYAFLFLFALCGVFFRQGVVRSPYAEIPTLARLIPVSLLLLAVYLTSLRGLFKRSSQ